MSIPGWAPAHAARRLKPGPAPRPRASRKTAASVAADTSFPNSVRCGRQFSRRSCLSTRSRSRSLVLFTLRAQRASRTSRNKSSGHGEGASRRWRPRAVRERTRAAPRSPPHEPLGTWKQSAAALGGRPHVFLATTGRWPQPSLCPAS